MNFSASELMLLRAGLRAYRAAFETHAAEDVTGVHSDEDVRELSEQVGQLLWKLEVIHDPSGGVVEHSEDAIPPTDR